MAADGAALIAAAVRAACLAKAPRRTVQSVAAAVASVLVRPAATVRERSAAEPAGTPCAAAGAPAPGCPSPEELLAALRAARASARKKKKERRRAKKVGAAAPREAANGEHFQADRGGDLPNAVATPVMQEPVMLDERRESRVSFLSNQGQPPCEDGGTASLCPTIASGSQVSTPGPGSQVTTPGSSARPSAPVSGCATPVVRSLEAPPGRREPPRKAAKTGYQQQLRPDRGRP